MKYTLEVNGNKATETLVVNGKEYKRTWENNRHGITHAYAGDFSDRVEADGFDNQEILNAIWNVLDSSFCVSDVIELCMMDEADGWRKQKQ